MLSSFKIWYGVERSEARWKWRLLWCSGSFCHLKVSVLVLVLPYFEEQIGK
jgi:hypothetical protein